VIIKYIKCERSGCTEEREIKSDRFQADLPYGWVLTHTFPAIDQTFRYMHFCSIRCAWKHQREFDRQETEYTLKHLKLPEVTA